jgi:hypothetical protein
MQLRLAGSHYAEIADTVQRSVATVRNWFQDDPLFRAEYEVRKAELRDGARDILFSAGYEAARALVKLLTDESGKVVLGAAAEILNRIGLKPTDKVQVEMEMRRKAEKLAGELGLDVNELIAEAERIALGGK